MQQFKALKDSKFIDNQLYYYVKPDRLLIPRFYNQPILHRQRVSTRFIVSYSGCPFYNLNKRIAKVEAAYAKLQIMMPGSTFYNYIRIDPIEGDEIMISLGVTSYHMNIHIDAPLNIITDNDLFTREMALLKDTIFNLGNLVLLNT